MKSVDILVPSVRLEEGPLLAILSLTPPSKTEVRWIIVSDAPEVAVPASVCARVDGDRIKLIRNPRNLGSAGSRNAALDASTAEWVLFLDDDVTPDVDLLDRYKASISAHPHAAGFFGPTRFVPGNTLYQRGVEVSDILTFFRVAEYLDELPWAPTSNVLVRGDAARAERFKTVFPKGGGGEDIDYLLRVSERAGGAFRAVPDATVRHPWWFGGARDYTRFVRWSYGDSLLHDLHPRHRYRSAPNAVELAFVLIPLALAWSIATASFVPVLAVALGIPLGEVVAEFGRLAALKGFPACAYCVETVLIRSSNDVGRFAMQLKLRRWRGFTERWDHFCNGQHIAYHQRWAAAKCAAHLAACLPLAWGLAHLL